MLTRLAVTPEALEVITLLEEKFGPLMFYQAGGCCEGTQPQCFEQGGFMLRSGDVCIGQIKGYDFWLDKDLFEYWKHMHFTLDVTEGHGPGGFSLETPYGKTFQVKYRLFEPEELIQLEPVRYKSYD
ncbi:DUF779 domain-containing protein [Flavobacterium sp.]|jgi:uncharacterized protein (DUF779 family)|uniref:DUF779 domain-containing protein n=1 Tax=Flavobacterium sp. TaxID=239 RepID=UPI0022C79FED|nr:DUF779 domain-containing protein [Flavobacterium sp.]MCZ8144626.1 DUF779 domain-containing protein [Flavobacterium sp.]MCZ8368122.1 DUF779 domain-containing protein [Flavobacterium sp.]